MNSLVAASVAPETDVHNQQADRTPWVASASRLPFSAKPIEIAGGCLRFLNLFGTETALCLQRASARLLKRCFELLIVKGDQSLAGLDAITFTHENL